MYSLHCNAGLPFKAGFVLTVLTCLCISRRSVPRWSMWQLSNVIIPLHILIALLCLKCHTAELPIRAWLCCCVKTICFWLLTDVNCFVYFCNVLNTLQFVTCYQAGVHKPNKFDFVHQTVSHQESRVGWAWDLWESRLGFSKWMVGSVMYLSLHCGRETTDHVQFVHLFLQQITWMFWHVEFTQQRAHTGWTTLHTG